MYKSYKTDLAFRELVGNLLAYVGHLLGDDPLQAGLLLHLEVALEVHPSAHNSHNFMVLRLQKRRDLG